jgi:RNA polymerase sigma-70 factor (ECF subfamily)
MVAEPFSPSDHELMRRTAAGDREAFETILRRHQRSVLSVAYRFLADRSQAEDAGQEVFLRLWRHAARYRPETALEAYLRTLTVNYCLDLRRKPELMALPDGEEPKGKEDPHGDLAAAERSRALDWALQSLAPAQRMAVVLFHLEGFPVKEVARLMDSSPKAAESLLSRARATLRERLEPLLRF